MTSATSSASVKPSQQRGEPARARRARESWVRNATWSPLASSISRLRVRPWPNSARGISTTRAPWRRASAGEPSVEPESIDEQLDLAVDLLRRRRPRAPRRAARRRRAPAARRSRWAPWRTYDGGVALDVAIQVVNYRTREHLEACLPTRARRRAAAARVLVLDNASGDDLSELAARHPEVEFVHGERNVGFGAGHNLLAARHDAAALLLLNPDTRFVEPRTVERHARRAGRRRARRRAAARVRDRRVGPARPRRAARLPRAGGAGGRAPATTGGATSRPTPPGSRAPRAWWRGTRSTPSAASTPASSSTRRRRTCSCASATRAGASATCRP